MAMSVDPETGMVIRPTDNGPKDCDLEASQKAEPLALGADGLPEGWEAPNGDR